MMKLKIFLLILFILLCFNLSFAQTTDKLTNPCPASTAKASIQFTRIGDINFVPCPTRTLQLNGSNISITGLASLNGLSGASQTFGVGAADTGAWSSSGTTHTLNLPITAISGSSRTNFFPYFNGANTLAKSPFSWNGTSYGFTNSAGNATFSLLFQPSQTTGYFEVGDTVDYSAYFILDQQNNSFLGQSRIVSLGDITPTQNATRISINDNLQTIGLNSLGVISLGDLNAGGNGTQLILDDGGRSLNFQEGTSIANVSFDLGNRQFDLNSGNGRVQIGDVNTLSNATLLTVDDDIRTITMQTQAANLVVDAGSIRVEQGKFYIINSQTPATATEACAAGQIAWDSAFIYVCVATNTWMRASMSTW